MKKTIKRFIAVFNALILLSCTQAFANEDKIELNLDKKDKHTLEISTPVKKLEGKLYKDSEESIKQAFEIQKKKDIEDIRILWESTIERNGVIKFALRKLAMPPEQRRIHSSVMARSVSTLISGVALLPGIFGADSVTSSLSSATGSLANRVIKNKSTPKEMPLTDTELIQLAALIEDLQNKVIKSYYSYKSSIEALKVSRDKLAELNKDYSKALDSRSTASTIVASAMYDKQLMREIKLKQDIKLYRLELERLAGKNVVSKLSLSKIDSFQCLQESPEKEITVEKTNPNKKVSLRELKK